MFLAERFTFKGENSQYSGSFDSGCQFSLMASAIARYPAGDDLAAFIGKAAQHPFVFVVNSLDVIFTEATDLSFSQFQGTCTATFLFLVVVSRSCSFLKSH
jgi:hypothetical protein